MSLVTVAVRRVRPHLATWLAVLASVLVTATTVGALSLLSGAIGEASTRGLLDAADPTDRSVSVTTTVAAGERAEADAAVAAVLRPLGEGGLRTEVATTTSRGIAGQPESARALVVEMSRPGDHADLVAGEWPGAVDSAVLGSPDAVVEVALHDGAAGALGTTVGETLELVDLLDADAGARPVRVVGTYLPRDPGEAVWAELPIAAEGTTTTEFETYGPFLLGAGAMDAGFAASATVTWRVTPTPAGADADAMADLGAAVARTLEAGRAAAGREDEPGAVPVLRGAQVGSGLPDLLADGAVLATRAEAAVLTPTFLLLLLGGTALAVSVSLLALLREPETRLLRTRGAGLAQIARMALLEGAVIVALAVVLLRVLPLLARVVGRLAETGSLPVAWGGWQVARRLGTQAGALLLILLAVPMGVLAVAQQATTARAIEDQSRFAVGADLRVEPRPDAVRDPGLVTRLATAAGGRERVMPAARETLTLGSLERVTLLRVDARTAGAVAQPRADLLGGASWSDLMTLLAVARPATSTEIGVPLPDGARSLGVTLELALRDTEVLAGLEERQPSGVGSVVLTDADGRTWATSLGRVVDGRSVEVELPDGLPRPLAVTAVQVTSALAWVSDEEGPLLRVGLAGLTADGTPIPTDGLEPALVRDGSATLLPVRPQPPPPPVVLTEAVAADLAVVPGDLITLPVRGQSVDVEVAGVIEALPTALVPDRGVVADLATLDAAALAAAGERLLTGTPPREFWLAPDDLTSAMADLREDPTTASGVRSAETVASLRRSSPVHAGLTAALLLVGAAAVLLAALGFAATTAAIGRTRRHESAVLHALGLAPGRIRHTVLLERWAVALLAVAAGTVVGVLVTYAVVPLLVGGDGHQLVPDVTPVVPWASVALVAAVTMGSLVLGTLLAARQVTSELSASLRTGEDP